MSAAVAQPVPVPNFAKFTRNVPSMQLPTFTPVAQQAPVPVPVPVVPQQAPVPVVPQQAPVPVPVPVVPQQAPASTHVNADQPLEFILNLSDLDTIQEDTVTSQALQYEKTGFSFKVPRVRSALTVETYDKNLTRTLDNIEKARPVTTAQGRTFTPISHLSQEDRDIIARAQVEYGELLELRRTEGVKQYKKELEAWLNMTHPVFGADGQPKKVTDAEGKLVDEVVLVPVTTRILRDVFTLDFKTDDDRRRFMGDASKKVDGLIKVWTREKRNLHERLPRSRRNGLQVAFEIPFNGTPVANGSQVTVSDELVASFNQLLAANSSGVQAHYQRVVGEYKTKLVRDKKTGQLVPQEKKRPSDYVVDTVSKMDEWKATATMVNRLRNRFSDELHVAVTVFIDYLVRQFSYVALVKCHDVKKKKIFIKHVLDNVSQIELFPLVSNFRSVQAAIAKHKMSVDKKLHGKTIGNADDEEEKKVVRTKKHPFEYCISAVVNRLTEELDRLNPGMKYSSFIVSHEYKLFMCEIIDEFIQTLGPILREEITNREVKTVNVDTFYTVIGSLLSWCRVNFKEVKSYVEERVRRYERYVEDETEDS